MIPITAWAHALNVLVADVLASREDDAQRFRNRRLAKRQYENCSWEEWRARRG